MQSSVARYANPSLAAFLLAITLAGECAAQADSRDVLIEQLRQRIETLEKRLENVPPAPAAPASPQPDIEKLREQIQLLEKRLEAQKPPSVAAPKPAASEETAREDEGARALERTLVRTGGLVLPKGAWEIEPLLQYSYRGSDQLRIVLVNGVAQIAQQDRSRDDLEASIGLRAGLPFSMQADVRIPYVWLREDRATVGASDETARTSGLGDLDIGLTTQLANEVRGRPALLASLRATLTTGDHDFGQLSRGSGFPQIQAGLTAVKRDDPLVFVGTLTYAWTFDRSYQGANIDPGNVFGASAGMLLAASPDTSLRAGLNLQWSGRATVAGASVAGSDTTVAMLELGLATLISARTLLDVQFGVGVTPDAPDFRLRVSLPVRY
jgi:hypothetical protein